MAHDDRREGGTAQTSADRESDAEHGFTGLGDLDAVLARRAALADGHAPDADTELLTPERPVRTEDVEDVESGAAAGEAEPVEDAEGVAPADVVEPADRTGDVEPAEGAEYVEHAEDSDTALLSPERPVSDTDTETIDAAAPAGPAVAAPHSPRGGEALVHPRDPAHTYEAADRYRPEVEETRMPPSPLDRFDAEEPRRGRGWLVAGVVVLVLALAYGAAAWFLGDRVPNGTVVAGVPVGGMTQAAATERLESELGPLTTDAIPVSVGEGLSSIDPAGVSLTLDVDSTLDPVTGFSLDPRVLWGRLFGMGDVVPATTVDEPALDAALQSVAAELEVAPVEGFIAYDGATPEITEPVPGTAVDVEAARTVVTEGWLTAERPIELPTRELEPAVDAAAVEDARTELAEPLVSGPVVVTAGEELAELTPEQLAAAASFTASGDRLELQLDGPTLADTVTEVNPDIVAGGEDAEIVLRDGRPTIIPSTSGRGFDAEALAAAVLEAGTSTERTAEVDLVEAEPEFTTADAEALGIKELVVEFSTPMPPDPVRTSNLVAGSRKVTGVIIEPGEEFSLLEHIAPITEANGYVSSGVVEDGFATTALGGGLSQLSTNMFNIGFLAGMDDVRHTPHTRWFDRYPAGREATVWESSTDMVWRNSTDHGVMVEAWVADGRLHSRLWGTKYWDVETSTSEKYDIVQPTTVYNPAEDCKPETGGQVGFTVSVDRQRYRDGALFDDESWTWTYRPWNHVVCGDPPAEDSEEPSSSPTPTG
ncbi:VanW family protein [Georgenia sp. M64]|uniref:VanW family protein n=1 Tax=Georgenia sp. M64 TaxID=3120520 RepID=UPI0030E42143